MNTITTMYNKVRVLASNLVGRSSYPGYRMTERSKAAWDKLEREKAQAQKESLEHDRRQAETNVVIRKARQMIHKANTEYQSAREKYMDKNMKVYTELTLNWSPQRVLSKHKDFARLCTALNDDTVWKKLSRKERAFVADAVRLK